MKIMLDDGELLRSYAEDGSEEAFATLVARHVVLVYRAALRQSNGDAHRAEDVTQEVFTLMARKAVSIRKHPRLIGWLYITTHHLMSDSLRSERRRRSRETEAVAAGVAGDGGGEQPWERIRLHLDDALRELPTVDREAILLRFFGGRTFSEIGDRLKMTEDAVRMRVSRALDRLRSALARRGIESTGAALAAMIEAETSLGAPAGLAGSVTTHAMAAAATAVPAASLLTIMSTTKFTIGIATLSVLAALVTATYEATKAYQAERALEMASASYDKLNILVDRLRAQSRLAIAQPGNGSPLSPGIGASANRLRTSAGKAGFAGPNSHAKFDSGAAGQAFLEKHPEVAALFQSWRRAYWRGEFSDFFVATGMSPTEIKQFEDLYIQHVQAGFGISQQGGFQFAASPTPQNAYSDLQSEIQAFLGPAVYAQYQDYVATLPARIMTNVLAAAVYDTDSPLTAAQAGELQQLYRQAMAPQDANRSNGAPQLSQPTLAAMNVVLSQSAGLLTPSQQAALANIVDQAKADAALTAMQRVPN